MATAAPDKSIDLGNVISKAVDVLSKNAPGFLAVGLVLSGIPAFLMDYWLAEAFPAAPTDATVGPFFLGLVLSLLVTLVTSALLQGILLRSAILHLGGRPADIGGSITATLGLVLPIIGLSILLGIAVVFGFMLLIVPGVILYCMFAVAVPVLVNERKGVFDSIGRSVQLTSGSRLMIFALAVILLILYWVINAVFGLFGGASAMLMGEGAAALALLAALGGAVTSSISAAVYSALYVELLTVKEGATTDGLAQVFA